MTGGSWMPNPFLSSEEYDDRAHQLYNEGRYEEALDTLREGLAIYPASVELQVGLGYAYHAREEYAWARRSFEEALTLDPEHEDALAGLGETLLKFGQRDAAIRTFQKTRELGYEDDVELMLQIGRALFREGLMEPAKEFFEVAVRGAPDHAEGVACVAYAQHRLGDERGAVSTLRRALKLDPDHVEARIYLGNILYDRGEYEAALYHLDRTGPDDHWDELGIWRLIELKKTIYRLREGDPDLKQWEDRIGELAGEIDEIDEMLAEIESRAVDAAEAEARGQLELFGTLLSSLAGKQDDLSDFDPPREKETHRITVDERSQFHGTWEEILRQMQRARGSAQRSLQEFMATEARRAYSLTGVRISTSSAERFIRDSADAGLLRILE
jgi:tetratricopeptide (TPR) repeat protein